MKKHFFSRNTGTKRALHNVSLQTTVWTFLLPMAIYCAIWFSTTQPELSSFISPNVSAGCSPVMPRHDGALRCAITPSKLVSLSSLRQWRHSSGCAASATPAETRSNDSVILHSLQHVCSEIANEDFLHCHVAFWQRRRQYHFYDKIDNICPWNNFLMATDIDNHCKRSSFARQTKVASSNFWKDSRLSSETFWLCRGCWKTFLWPNTNVQILLKGSGGLFRAKTICVEDDVLRQNSLFTPLQSTCADMSWKQ